MAALLAVFVLPVRAQHYIGARAGWGVGYGRFAPVSWFPMKLIWHIHMNFSDNRLRVFLNAGIWASYNVGAYEWVKSGNTVTEGPYHMTLVKDNPLGYGLLGGLRRQLRRHYAQQCRLCGQSGAFAARQHQPVARILLPFGRQAAYPPAAALVCTHHRQKGGQACAAGAGGDEENGGDGRYRRDNGRGDDRGCRGNRDGRNNRHGGYRGRHCA